MREQPSGFYVYLLVMKIVTPSQN